MMPTLALKPRRAPTPDGRTWTTRGAIEAMRILIGYSMRSGSTLLEHVLDGHSQLRAYGDLSSILALSRRFGPRRDRGHICVKPMDLLYLQQAFDFYRHFDKFIWLARDPRDSYLSTIESGYAYLFWLPGRRCCGIDTGLIKRWQRIYRHYFERRDSWYLVRYEDLAERPHTTLECLLEYLELPHETLIPFARFSRRHGGDYKLSRRSTISGHSAQRFRHELTVDQLDLFDSLLGGEIAGLGYPSGTPANAPASAATSPI